MADENKNTYTVKEIIEFVWKDVKDIKAKLEKQNGRIRKNEIKIGSIIACIGLIGAAIAIVKIL